MSLPEFSVRQVVLVNILFVMVIGAGLFAFVGIPVEVFPDISFNTAIVNTVWPGASADEIERLVTTKLEEEIQEVAGIKDLTSSSLAGVSSIDVEWDESLSAIQQESSLNELRAAIDRVNDLPGEAEKPVVFELSVHEVRPSCMVAVSDVGGVGEYTLREVSRDLEIRLERIPGVRKTVPRGDRDRELRVYVDRQRALQANLTLPEINAVIRANNQNIPAGSFVNDASDEITVRGLGNFSTPESLAATVIKKDVRGRHITLGEIATVEGGFESRRLFGRYNGDPAIHLGVAQESGVDVRELVARVHQLVDEANQGLPPGVEATVTWDSSTYIESRMALLQSNLLIGVMAVVAVLWFTVGFRNALLAILAVPFSFLFALYAFPYMGMSLNSLTLIGFIMVSGMLVDHAIIIIENIYRHVEEGFEVRTAIIEGTRQVMWPVIATVATTLAAFLPMLLVSGTSGEFFSLLPKAVIVTLVGSLFEALIILPAHYLDWGSTTAAGTTDDAGEGGFVALSHRARASVDGFLMRSRDSYLRALEPVLRYRGSFFLVCCAALAFSCGLTQHVPIDLFKSDFNQFYITTDGPIDAGVDQTSESITAIDAALSEFGAEITDYLSYAGMKMSADGGPQTGTNYGAFYIQFPDTSENVAHPERIFERVRSRVEETMESSPGIEKVFVFAPRNGPPVGKPVAIRVFADDYALAKRVAAELKADLATIPGVFNIEDNLPIGPRELRVRLDEHRASLHGLTFQDVGIALRAANDGLVPSTFKDPASDEDVDIRVMYPKAQRSSIADLLDVEIRSPAGHTVKLGDVARIEVERSYQSLYHYDARRAVVVYAEVDKLQATSVSANREMASRFADASVRWPGVSLVFGGEAQETERSISELLGTLFIALVAIYAILATQFRSYLQPVVVMSVIAFAFIGVILGMFVLDYPLTMYVFYAMVGLAGIVVNDSLVLIDFVNQGRARGLSSLDAVRESCSLRFRPILLTTVTTIAGLFPMAVGLGGTHPVYSPFAAGIVFGLAVASGLTLFTVPALYLMVEGGKERVTRLRIRQEPMIFPSES
ncbi:MAG: efflux RND transporter permease subunit [bacterium]|nr:efflux RND transporter permease subunit [bacterium]